MSIEIRPLSDQDQIPTDGSLTRAIVSAGAWSILNNAGTKALGAIKNLILARLLSPLDFGLIGLAHGIIGTVNRFSTPGVYSALIQKKDLLGSDLNVGWWIYAGRGLLLLVLFFPLAGPVSVFFREPRLEVVLQVMSLTFLLDGLQSIGVVRLNRELNFRALMWLQQTSNLAGLALALALALWLRNVWALVFATLAQLLVQLVVSFVLQPFMPKLEFDRQRAKQLLHFGRFFFAAAVFYFLIVRGNEFLVGRMAGVERYGYFALAMTLIGAVSAPLEQLITSVAFPAMSRIQAEPERIVSAHRRLFRTAMLASTPVFLGIAVFGQDLVFLVLGAKWAQSLWPLIWLSFFEWFNTLTLTVGVLHFSTGRADLQAALRAYQLVFYAGAAIPLTYYWGAAGAALCLAVAAATFLVVQLCVTSRSFPGVSRSLAVFASYWPLFVISAAVAYARFYLPAGWLFFLASGLFYTVAVTWFVYRVEKDLLWDLVKSIRRPTDQADRLTG